MWKEISEKHYYNPSKELDRLERMLEIVDKNNIKDKLELKKDIKELNKLIKILLVANVILISVLVLNYI